MKIDFHEAITAVQGMLNGFIERLPHLVLAVGVFFVFFFVAKGVRATVRAVAERHRRHLSLGLVLGRIAHGVIVLVGLLVALVIAVPGFTPGQLISLLGLSSVAIGFAFRDILQNFFAGILLLVTEPFRIGDQIVLKDFEGTVEDIQTRATFLRTYDGRRVVIPNSLLFTESVTVNTANDKRRLQYDVGIGYGDDIARAKELMLEVLRETEGVLADPPPEALVVDLAGSSVNVRARWWISPPRRADVVASTDQVLAAIKGKLAAHGVDLPFPTQHVLFHDQTEETDGDRSRQREGWPAGNGGAPKSRSIAAALRPAASEGANGRPSASSEPKRGK